MVPTPWGKKHCGPLSGRCKGYCCSLKKSITFARCRDGGRLKDRTNADRAYQSRYQTAPGRGWNDHAMSLSYGREILGLGACAFGGSRRFSGHCGPPRDLCVLTSGLYFQPTNSLLLVSGIEKWSTHESLGGPKRTSCSKEWSLVCLHQQHMNKHLWLQAHRSAPPFCWHTRYKKLTHTHTLSFEKRFVFFL